MLEELLLEVVEAILTAAFCASERSSVHVFFLLNDAHIHVHRLQKLTFTVLVIRVVIVVIVVELRVEVVVTGQVTVIGLLAAWPLRISLCQVS